MSANRNTVVRGVWLGSFLLLSGLSLAQETRPATPTPMTPARERASEVQQAFAEVARQVLPSVVTVRAFVRVPAKPVDAAEANKGEKATSAGGWEVAGEQTEDYPGFKLLSAGSGFVVDAKGEVLTCLNALKKPDGSMPDLLDVEANDGSRMIAEIVGSEPTVNLAIVQCTVFPTGKSQLVPLRFGDSDAVETGHWVLGFGDPSGPDKFIGIGTFIARPTRDCYQDYLSAFFLQVAMVAPPQAYGGPLVNLRGEVIGVLAPRHPQPGNVAEPRFGIEYAMPSKIVEGLWQSIRQVRSSKSPWLGFSVMSRAEIAAARGLEAFQAMQKPKQGILIENVFQPSPAGNLGILPGDFLMALDSTTIFAPVDFQKALYLAGIGKRVRLKLYREGSVFEQEIQIEVRPQDATPR